MREEVAAHIFLVVGGRLDVHKRARQFEKMHSNQAFLDERNERKEPRGYEAGCRLSIALHPNVRTTVNRSWTCSPTTAVSAAAAISADKKRFLGPYRSKKSPFCAGIRSCSELPARLLMASAPLPRQTKF